MSQGTANVARPGDATVTFCDDPEIDFGGTATTQPTNHGCANAPATAKDSVVKTYLAFPTHVHLVYANTGTAADPCHSGDKFKENTIGQTDTLLACTNDPNNNPASTEQAGAGTIQWLITTAAGGQTQLATRFAGSPPTETGTDGTATAQVQAVNEGSDVIQVFLVDENGNRVSTDFVEKRVRRAGETQPPTSGAPTGTTTVTVGPTQSPQGTARAVSLETSDSKVRFGRIVTLAGGITSTDPACAANQTVEIVRTVVGSEKLESFTTVTTNAGGSYSLTFVPDRSANYVAHLPGSATCGEANSDAVPVLVRAAVSLSLSQRRIARGGRIGMTARVRPCETNHLGGEMVLFRRVGGQLAKIGKGFVSTSCSIRFTRVVTESSAFQARWPKQDADHEAGRSRAKAVAVRR